MIESGSKIVRSSELNLLGQFFLKKVKIKSQTQILKTHCTRTSQGRARQGGGKGPVLFIAGSQASAPAGASSI